MSLHSAMELIAWGSMRDMRLWLVKNELKQPNGHAPLCDCNSALLMRLVADQALLTEKGEKDDA